jgi:excisionase family DNA binding protein
MGLLQTVARFGIVPVGPWTIDLEALEEDMSGQADSEEQQKVAYSAGAAALFDRAAAIAREDDASQVEPVHMLVASAAEDEGIMGELKRTYGFTSTQWRAALVDWQPPTRRPAGPDSNGAAEDGRRPELQDKMLLSPDEAAELLGVHTQTVRGYIRDGKLKAHRVAGERAIRIRRQDLLALLEPYNQD